MPNIIKALETNSTAIDTAQAKVDVLNAKRDELLVKARDEGVGYKEIAAATGKSFSWINSRLFKVGGPRPRAGRPRRA